jgi:oligopeptide/dipeptide ABC transporter ATP-binding protein
VSKAFAFFLRPFRHPVTRAFMSAPSGVFALVVLSILAFAAAFGPAIYGDEAETQDFSSVNLKPSWDHWLGTDGLGRDIFARIVVATRLSLEVALAAAGMAALLGITLGAVAALSRGRTRPALLRFIDSMISFPGLLKAIVVGVIVGVGTGSVILGIGIASSFGFARTTSTLALSVGGRDYINAARVVGVKPRRLLTRYVLPNIAEPLIVFFGISIAAATLAASSLSFLGLGVQPPQVDWGRMLTEGVRDIYTRPAAALGPAFAIALTALAFGYAGEAMARAVNPLLWTAGRKRRRRRAPVDLAAEGERRDPGLLPPPRPEEHGANGAGEPAAAVAAEDVASTNGVALEVHDLEVTFPGPNGPIRIVKGVSFTARPGEILGIVGESGSGKTMTALAIAQLTPFPGRVTGGVVLHGKNLMRLPPTQLKKLLATDVAVVFQDPMSSLNPALTVGTQLTERVRVHAGLDRKAAHKLAVEKLTEVHIPAAARQLKRYPHEFSGGMRQRAMIAMGLMSEPTLLICDEPTTALDVTIQAQIMDLLTDVNREHNSAIILISHNLALVSQNCHRVLVMYAGRIVEELDADQLTTDPKHPYTRALLGAVPEIGHRRDEPLEFIPGETPDIGSPPGGCPYHPRCPLAVERCQSERPLLLTRPGESGRRVACHVANADIEDVAYATTHS